MPSGKLVDGRPRVCSPRSRESEGSGGDEQREGGRAVVGRWVRYGESEDAGRPGRVDDATSGATEKRRWRVCSVGSMLASTDYHTRHTYRTFIEGDHSSPSSIAFPSPNRPERPRPNASNSPSQLSSRLCSLPQLTCCTFGSAVPPRADEMRFGVAKCTQSPWPRRPLPPQPQDHALPPASSAKLCSGPVASSATTTGGGGISTMTGDCGPSASRPPYPRWPTNRQASGVDLPPAQNSSSSSDG